MSVTGTPIWPDFVNISCADFWSAATFMSSYSTLFSVKNSFVLTHHGHVGVLYTFTFAMITSYCPPSPHPQSFPHPHPIQNHLAKLIERESYIYLTKFTHHTNVV